MRGSGYFGPDFKFFLEFCWKIEDDYSSRFHLGFIIFPKLVSIIGFSIWFLCIKRGSVVEKPVWFRSTVHIFVETYRTERVILTKREGNPWRHFVGYLIIYKFWVCLQNCELYLIPWSHVLSLGNLGRSDLSE